MNDAIAVSLKGRSIRMLLLTDQTCGCAISAFCCKWREYLFFNLFQKLSIPELIFTHHSKTRS